MEVLNHNKKYNECTNSVLTFKLDSSDIDGMGNSDESKSTGLESYGSKMMAEDEHLMNLGSKESVVDSSGGRTCCNDGDAESEVVGVDAVKEKSSSLKRTRDCTDEEDLLWSNRRKKSIASMQDDELISLVAESDAGTVFNGQDDVITLDPEVSGEESTCTVDHSPLLIMLKWLNGISKDPCDPEIGSLPESLRWKFYGSEKMWKRVLLSREALLFERYDDLGAKRAVWQKNQRMHPSMYEDRDGSNYKLRERLNCKKNFLQVSDNQLKKCSETSSSRCPCNLDKGPSAEYCSDYNDKNGDSSSSSAELLFESHGGEDVPLGSEFQAEVPEWTGVISESDSKWLGKQIWPLKNVQRRTLIEREPIGKGRQDSCGCPIRGSAECVRFHIAEKRKRLEAELGAAFHIFKLDDMGEEVKCSWTREEQEKFATVIRLNPPSQGKCFWDQMFKDFPSKSRAELVSYYFNVFLMLRRGDQNRCTPLNVDSDDDDEWEPGSVVDGVGHQESRSSSSIFYSPTKPHSRLR